MFTVVRHFSKKVSLQPSIIKDRDGSVFIEGGDFKQREITVPTSMPHQSHLQYRMTEKRVQSQSHQS